MLNARDKVRLDTICAEARARLDALDLEMYHRGFVTRKGTWGRPSVPMAGANTSTKKGKGPSPLTIDKPTGPNILGPSPVLATYK